MAKRILESEAMVSLDEVRAYDQLTLKYLKILHNGFVESVVNNSPTYGRFLEVGSGTGRITIGVAKINREVDFFGIDLSDTMLQVAESNSRDEGVSNLIRFEKGSATDLPFPDNSFDAVYCHNMLHHVPDIPLAIKEMMRVTKDDGALLIRDLIRQSPVITSLHVNIFGFTYTPLMKKEYRDSIQASLSWPEINDLFNSMDLPDKKLKKYFLTHYGIERASERARGDKIKIPTPSHLKFMKNLYVS